MTVELERRERLDDLGREPLPPLWAVSESEVQPDFQVQAAGLWISDASGKLQRKLCRIVGEARETICVAAFLLADQPLLAAINAATRRGVRVYILTASETRLQREPREDSEFDRRLLSQHEQMLADLAQRCLVRTGEDLHSKFLLADPNQGDGQGMLLTANLTTEALTRNLELGVELSRDEIHDLFRQFLLGFWTQSQRELLSLPNTESNDRSGQLTPVRPAPPTDLPCPTMLPCTAREVSTLREAVLKLIQGAQRDLWVASFGFELNHQATQALLNRALEGVRVRILTWPRATESQMNSLISLAKVGAEVRGFRYLHAKCVLADAPSAGNALVMTANFETHGLDDGFDSGILLDETRSQRLREIYERWWETAPSRLLPAPKRSDVMGRVLLWEAGRLEEAEVAAEYTVDLGLIGQGKRSREGKASSPEFPPVPVRDQRSQVRKLYHRHRFTWQEPRES